MRLGLKAGALLACLMLSPASSLNAAVLDDPLTSDRHVDHLANLYDSIDGIYDSGLNRLTIISLTPSADTTTNQGNLLVFASRLLIVAGIDEFGNVTDRGSMLWEGDFGTGLQVLATGEVQDIGFISIDKLGPNDYNFLGFHLLMGVNYASPLLDGFAQRRGSHIGLSWEDSVNSQFESPFLQDWICRGGGPPDDCGGPWSISRLEWFKVPEPGILALLSIGLAGLAFTRRRKH